MSGQSLRLIILRSALADIEYAYQFYEGQETGLGAYFEDSIFNEIDNLVSIAGVHRQMFGHHRMLMKKFPYAIYYRIADEAVKIHAVIDCRQNPEQLRNRLA